MNQQDEFAHLSFRLSDDFVDQYRDREVKWGFDCGAGNTLGELTWLTKYSRVKADGTKETWVDGCRRVIEGVYSILKDHCIANRTPWNHAKAARAAEDAFERMFTFKWTPPGRGLWMMGTKFVWDEGSAALQNCYRSDVEIITSEGVKTLGSVAGTNQIILTEGGKWVEAPIRSFGEQSLMKVILTRSKGESKTIYATPEHRWFVRDRRAAHRRSGWVEMQTQHLRPGVHQLQDVYGQGVKQIVPSPFGVAHGFAFGDGRKSQGDRNSNTVTLFGEKDKALTPYFELCSSRWNLASIGGREYSGLPNYFFDVPDITEAKSYLYGWLAGYFAADGCVSESGSVTILSHSEDDMKFLRDVCYILGIGTYGIRHTQRESNLDGKVYDKYAVTFMRDTLTEDFFILDEHRQRWADHPSDKRLRWRVESVEKTDLVEEVFCVTVDGYGKFALADNILTGNCAFLSTEHLGIRNPTGPFVRLMEMSMLGIGVGFDTLGEGNLTIHKTNGEVEHYQIPDSREGWCESVNKLLRSYFTKSQPRVEFDYSLVRPAGEPIKRFGGVAAGPGPLRRLHEHLRDLLEGRDGETITSTDIVDIMNMIGKCVVAGNVRRSAEIAFGDPDDKEFLQLKDWNVNPERMGPDGWGYLSNNSVMAKVGGHYDHLVDLIALNGEPGLNYLDLARDYGRLVDPPNGKDYRAKGANPCAEQTLEDGECCTLVVTYPIKHEDLDDYLKTLKVAYLYGKAVTLLPTHWPETNEVMQRNRRIGTSMSGIAQFAEAHGWTELRRWMDEGYKEVVRRDVQYSEWLGIRESIKTTSIKPSGTVSLLAGVTPGVHWPEHDVYLRRMRFRVGDEMVPVFEEAGYHVEPDVMDPENTVVVTFPTRGPQVRTTAEVSVWEKVSLAVTAQRWWADNQVSATFTFRADEKGQIGPLLRSFDGQLKSMSFLPMLEDGTAYQQMPYERIDLDEWEQAASRVTRMDLSPIYENGVAPEGELYCTTDMCIISDEEQQHDHG